MIIIPQPAQRPPDDFDERIIASLKPDEEWREVPGYIHRSCGGQAYANPYNDTIFGCLFCCQTGLATSGLFEPIQ